MFNSYGDAQLMNESFVFYTSTNTFRNPAFAQGLAEGLGDQGPGGSAIANATIASEQNMHPNEDQPPVASQDLEQKENTQLGSGGAPGASRRGPPASHLGPGASTKQKLIDFCDNFALSLRGKVFVMETNFKRRLRGLRKFLDKHVLPWVAHVGQADLGCASRNWPENIHRRGATPRAAMAQSVNCGGSTRSASLRDLAEVERHELGRRFSRDYPKSGSSRALGLQQEQILTRLERIKRDSQRLFNMENATILESDNETDDELREHDLDAKHHSGVSGINPSVPGPLHVPVWFGGRSSVSADGETALCRKSTTQSLGQPKKTCIVCYERAPNIVTLPCEHDDICSDCFIEIIYMAVKSSQYPLRCVLCRQKVERIRCSRRLMLSVIRRNRSRKTGSKAKISCK